MSIKRVTTRAIDDQQITVDKLANNSVTTDKISNGSVTLEKVAANAVDSTKIADDAVTELKIASSAVTNSKLATDSVDSSKILSGAVTNVKLSTDAVAETNIAAGAVTNAKLSTNAVASTNIVSSAVTTAKIADSNVTPAKLSQPLTLATAQASTSGASIDFTSIPNWVRRITVIFNGVSTNGTSLVQIQLGSTSFQNTGYISSAQQSTSISSSTTGIVISTYVLAADIRIGAVVLMNVSDNTWIASGATGQSSSTTACSGKVSLTGTLDRIRITTVNGTDTFDAGSINIMYE